MCRWQAASSRPIEANGGLDPLSELARRFGGVTPPHGGSSHDHRGLRFFKQGSSFVYKIGIGCSATAATILLRCAWINDAISISKVVEDIHRHFEKNGPGLAVEHL